MVSFLASTDDSSTDTTSGRHLVAPNQPSVRLSPFSTAPAGADPDYVDQRGLVERICGLCNQGKRRAALVDIGGVGSVLLTFPTRKMTDNVLAKPELL